MRISLNSRLLAFAWIALGGVQPALAQPESEVTLSIADTAQRYLRASQQNDISAQTDASSELSRILFYQPILSETVPKKRIPKDWNPQSIALYKNHLGQIESTLVQFPEVLAALGMVLQKTWEQFAFDHLNRYHFEKHAIHQTREAAGGLASAALWLAIPSSWMGLGGASVKLAPQIGRAKLLLTAIAAAGGGMQVWSRIKGQQDFPPSPAEILTFGQRARQDYRWEEASDQLARTWQENGTTLVSTAAHGFALSRAVTSLGGLRAIVGEGLSLAVPEAATSGVGASLGTVGLGALVIASVGTTSYFVSQIEAQKLHEAREKEVTKNFLNALQNAMHVQRLKVASTEQLRTSSKLLEALGRLEAFHYAQLLQAESAILMAKSQTIAATFNNESLDQTLPTLDALNEAALVGFQSFWEGRYSNPRTQDSWLQLRGLEALSQWRVNSAEEASAALEDPENIPASDLRQQMRLLVQTYQDQKALQSSLFGTDGLPFRKWLRSEYKARVNSINARLGNYLQTSAEQALFELSDVSSVLFETAIWMIESPSEIERNWGSDLLERAVRYIDLKNWLSQETKK